MWVYEESNILCLGRMHYICFSFLVVYFIIKINLLNHFLAFLNKR